VLGTVTRPANPDSTVSPRTPGRARLVAGAPIGAAAVAAVVVIVHFVASVDPVDYLTYRYGAAAAWGGVDLYHGQVSGPHLPGQPFTYTPFAAVALLPTTWLGWQVNYLLLSLASMLVLAWALARFIPATTPRRTLVLVAALGAASTTCVVVANIVYGQINILLMGLCLADLFRSDTGRSDTGRFGRAVPRGVLVGLAAAIKLTPGLFIVFFLVTRQWRLARWSITGATAATLLGAMMQPAMTFTFFRSALWTLPDRVDLGHPLGYWGNNSIHGAIASLGAPVASLALPVVAAFAGATLLAAARLHRQDRDADAWLVVGMAMPLVSPFSWTHHVVFLLAALTRLAFGGGGALRPARISAVLAAVAALHWGPALGQRWLGGGHLSLFVPGLVMRESLVLTSVGCILLLWRSGPPGVQQPGVQQPSRPGIGAVAQPPDMTDR
jgi:alpha-1,2-mannosyltransferase